MLHASSRLFNKLKYFSFHFKPDKPLLRRPSWSSDLEKESCAFPEVPVENQSRAQKNSFKKQEINNTILSAFSSSSRLSAYPYVTNLRCPTSCAF